jgi:hypothetical protein
MEVRYLRLSALRIKITSGPSQRIKGQHSSRNDSMSGFFFYQGAARHRYAHLPGELCGCGKISLLVTTS